MREKAGYSVEMAIICRDENGDIISVAPSYIWHGWSRCEANKMALDIEDAIRPAVRQLITGYNELLCADQQISDKNNR